MNPYRVPAERPGDPPAPRRKLWRTERHLLPAMCGAWTAYLALQAFACTPPQTAQQAAAEGAYGAALLRCVDEATTLAESKACRARVDEAWGITQTGKDGGR